MKNAKSTKRSIFNFNFPINNEVGSRLEFSSANSWVRLFNHEEKKMTVYDIKNIERFLSHTVGCVPDNSFRNELFSLQEKEEKDEINKMTHQITTQMFDNSANSILSCLAQKPIEDVENIMNNGGTLLLYAYYTEAQDWYNIPKACNPFNLETLDIDACAEALPAGDVVYHKAPEQDEL